MEKCEKCNQGIMDRYHMRQCQRTAWKDGKCRQHHPDTIKIRDDERQKIYEEKQKQRPWYLMKQKDEEIAKLTAEVARLKEENERIRVKAATIATGINSYFKDA